MNADVQNVVVLINKAYYFVRFAADFLSFKSAESADSVVLVNNVIAGFQSVHLADCQRVAVALNADFLQPVL